MFTFTLPAALLTLLPDLLHLRADVLQLDCLLPAVPRIVHRSAQSVTYFA